MAQAFISLWKMRYLPADDALHDCLRGKSGQLSELMARAADQQETLLQNRIALTLALFEPALIITMAMIVLFIIVSVLQPILQLNSLVS